MDHQHGRNHNELCKVVTFKQKTEIKTDQPFTSTNIQLKVSSENGLVIIIYLFQVRSTAHLVIHFNLSANAFEIRAVQIPKWKV
jgi:hypothetical protein